MNIKKIYDSIKKGRKVKDELDENGLFVYNGKKYDLLDSGGIASLLTDKFPALDVIEGIYIDFPSVAVGGPSNVLRQVQQFCEKVDLDYEDTEDLVGKEQDLLDFNPEEDAEYYPLVVSKII